MAKGCAWTGPFKWKWQNIGETHGNNNDNYCQLLLVLHTCTTLNNAHARTLARGTVVNFCNCVFRWLISTAISVSKAGPCLQVNRLVSSKFHACLPSLSLIRVSTWAVWMSLIGEVLLNLCTWAPESAEYRPEHAYIDYGNTVKWLKVTEWVNYWKILLHNGRDYSQFFLEKLKVQNIECGWLLVICNQFSACINIVHQFSVTG